MGRSAENPLVLASFSLLMSAAPALGGEVTSKTIIEDTESKPTIKVKSTDGKSYQTVESASLQFKVHVGATCNWVSTDREVKVTIGQTTDNLDGFWDGVPKGFGAVKSYAIATPYMNPNIIPGPVEACNIRLQELVQQGQPAWKVLHDGFTLVKSGAYEAKLTVTCGAVDKDKETTSAPLHVELHCLPSNLAKAPTPTPTPTRTHTPTPAAQRVAPVGGKISSVSLTVDPPDYKGTCPTNVKFHAHIVPAEPIKLGWMIEGDGDYQSPKYTLDITTSTPKNPTTFRTIERPSTTGQLTSGGPAKLPLVQGWAQLRVWDTEKPGTGSLRSARMPFTVDCNPVSPAVGGSIVIPPTPPPKGLAAQPTPRRP